MHVLSTLVYHGYIGGYSEKAGKAMATARQSVTATVRREAGYGNGYGYG